MKTRVLVLGLLAAAAAVHVLVTVPLQRRAATDGDQFRRMRDERRLAQARLSRFQRGETLRRQAAGLLAGAAAEDAVRLVRRSLIASLDRADVSKVRVSVRPGSRDHVAATVTLTAEGDFDDVVRLSSQVVRNGSGLLLQAVTFSPRPPVVGVAVEALGPRGVS